MCNARVYKITKGRWRLYIPDELRYDVVADTHKFLCHAGIDKTLAAVKETYYFPKMRELITRYVTHCVNCVYYKTPTGKPVGYLYPYEKGKQPLEVLHIDYLGPFICTDRGNNYVIAAIDGFSKYYMLKAVGSANAQEAIDFVKEVVNTYGRPVKIITDRGVAFTSEDFETLCSELNIEHVKVATATPRANGQVERLNRVIISSLGTTTNNEGHDWDKRLLDVQWAINNTEHRITKRTPYEIMYGRKGRGISDNPLTIEIMRLNEELCLEEEKEPVESFLEKKSRRSKEIF